MSVSFGFWPIAMVVAFFVFLPLYGIYRAAQNRRGVWAVLIALTTPAGIGIVLAAMYLILVDPDSALRLRRPDPTRS